VLAAIKVYLGLLTLGVVVTLFFQQLLPLAVAEVGVLGLFLQRQPAGLVVARLQQLEMAVALRVKVMLVVLDLGHPTTAKAAAAVQAQ